MNDGGISYFAEGKGRLSSHRTRGSDSGAHACMY